MGKCCNPFNVYLWKLRSWYNMNSLEGEGLLLGRVIWWWYLWDRYRVVIIMMTKEPVVPSMLYVRLISCNLLLDDSMKTQNPQYWGFILTEITNLYMPVLLLHSSEWIVTWVTTIGVSPRKLLGAHEFTLVYRSYFIVLIMTDGNVV